MVVTAVADPSLAPWWDSKDAKNLFVPKKSNVNMCKAIIRRIDILELARTDPNGYMEIIEGGNEHGNCTDFDILKIQEKCLFLRKALRLGLKNYPYQCW